MSSPLPAPLFVQPASSSSSSSSSSSDHSSSDTPVDAYRPPAPSFAPESGPKSEGAEMDRQGSASGEGNRGQTWEDFMREAASGEPYSDQLPTFYPPSLYSQPRGNYSQPFQHYTQSQQQLPPYLGHTQPASASASASASTSRFATSPRSARPEPERSSSDRKRRLTTAESPMRRASTIRTSSSAATPTGTSNSDLLVLGSMPPGTGGTGGSAVGHGEVRRDSDLVLPLWQPDYEATHCFVCGSQFTFFYRKHHCRKCGRVVCSACSPHRITIPRQFIVHPPNDTPDVIDLTTDDEENLMSAFGPFRNPALGGGEEVRVCNPCVPDPNFSPPPYTPAQTPYPPHPSLSGAPWPHHTRHHSSQSVSSNPQTPGYGHGQTNPSRDPFTDRRTNYHGSARVADLWSPHPTDSDGNPALHSDYMGYEQRPRAHTSRPSTNVPTHLQRASSNRLSSNPSMFRRPAFLSQGTHGPPSAPVPAPTPQPQRREIPEEDECPICGNELPPKGSDGDEAGRTQHVEDCIKMHSSSPPPVPSSGASQTSTSLPAQRTRGMSSAGNGEGASNRNRMSMSARGMIVYTATEKDCVDDEGEAAECVICFEEFEQGDRMARLVCFCKFHEVCIKKWWDTKGRGACPTHQLHE
ncbi:hypothetical protein P280DRAFT_476490 [Massarina eburnea CBS 473.64]|uniref:RING-type E3 ubiquitin transferase n=1 Tax=Massarina eburnea CBS 473.64 TaxID=1395130 RepID=A0A6A6SB18_9PLEO|nr:hypothetical protein P280DRAFT_476490 [Massarina eburnea CBS 473.64]